MLAFESEIPYSNSDRGSLLVARITAGVIMKILSKKMRKYPILPKIMVFKIVGKVGGT